MHWMNLGHLVMPDREEGIRIIKDSERSLKGLRPKEGTFLSFKKDNFIDG